MEKKIIYLRDIGSKTSFDINKENIVISNKGLFFDSPSLAVPFPADHNIKFVNVYSLSDNDYMGHLAEKIKNNEKVKYLFNANKKISLLSKKDVEEFVLNNELQEFTNIRNSETFKAYEIFEKIMEYYKNKVGVVSLNNHSDKLKRESFIEVYSSINNIVDDIINR